MSRLDEFLRLLCGRFDNTRQLEELRRSGTAGETHVALYAATRLAVLLQFCGSICAELLRHGGRAASPHLFLFAGGGGEIIYPAAKHGRRRLHGLLPP